MSRVTYDAGNLTIEVDGLDTVAAALGDLKKKTPAAAKVAINATARQARKLMIAKAKARYAVNAAGRRHLKDLVQRKKASNTSLSAELHIAKMRNDLGYFQHRPTERFTGREVLHHAPKYVKARVLKASSMAALTGNANMSKGFLVQFKSGHIGMVQRQIGSSSSHTVTERDEQAAVVYHPQLRGGGGRVPHFHGKDAAMSRVTYDAGNLTIEVDGLDTVAAALGDLKKKTPAAAKVAINATARQARKLMIAKAKARYAVNAAGRRHLKDLVQRKKASNTSLSAELHIAKMRNDLGYFQHRPTERFTGREVLHHAPKYVKARVLKASSMAALTGNANMSKGFLVQFKSGHIGMVQRQIGSSSSHTVTERGRPRWRNKDGKVEKLVTMGSPSASAMHSTVWPMVEPEVSEYLQDRLMEQTERVLARAARRK